MSLFRASVSAGECGPVITLSGETDMSTVAELDELVAGQLADGTRCLIVDVAGLDFADTGSIRVFLLAARMLRQRGGDLVLLRPQPALARVLENHRRRGGHHDPGRNRARARTMILAPRPMST